MKKVLLAAALVAAGTAPAHAGFTTGFVVGAALASGGGKHAPQEQFIASDTHDVIICQKALFSQACKDVRVPSGEIRSEIAPALYAGINGYKVLHKVAVLMVGNVEYIVMEVSK